MSKISENFKFAAKCCFVLGNLWAAEYVYGKDAENKSPTGEEISEQAACGIKEECNYLIDR